MQYHKPNKDNPSGHWTLPGGKDAPSSGGKNCLFDVVAAQTGKDPNKLRANTATRMENNKAMVANQAHDIKRLEQYKKDALTMGGKAEWDPNNLNRHFKKHGEEFPECKNSEEYGKKANDQLDNPSEGSETHEYYDDKGKKHKAVYDPETKTWVDSVEVDKDKEKTTTMFKPEKEKEYVDELKEKNKDNGPKKPDEKPAEEEKKPESEKPSGDKKPEESKNDPQINKSIIIPKPEKFPGYITPIPKPEKFPTGCGIGNGWKPGIDDLLG